MFVFPRVGNTGVVNGAALDTEIGLGKSVRVRRAARLPPI